MIVTARQLEDLHRQGGSNGHITLPYRARLSPLGADWVRAKRIVVGYGDVTTRTDGGAVGIAKAQAAEPAPLAASHASSTTGAFLWWCDGPCGPAKAAIVAQEKESALKPLDKPADAKQLVTVVKAIAAEVKSAKIQGAILLVQNGALAAIYANRCPSLRAVLGTCMEAVEQGVQQAAANVLIIEYPYKTLQQVRNLLSRFTRVKRNLPEDVRRQLQELASCG
jgi:ribose 5-phosphate isomerase RpiB